MEKKTHITIRMPELKDFLLKKGSITERDSISEIHLIAHNGGILIELSHLDFTEKQKEFMNMLIKDMGITVKLKNIIKSSAYGVGTVTQSKIFEHLRGSDLFNPLVKKESYWIKISGSDKKTIKELNELFKKYDLPPLEK